MAPTAADLSAICSTTPRCNAFTTTRVLKIVPAAPIFAFCSRRVFYRLHRLRWRVRGERQISVGLQLAGGSVRVRLLVAALLLPALSTAQLLYHQRKPIRTPFRLPCCSLCAFTTASIHHLPHPLAHLVLRQAGVTPEALRQAGQARPPNMQAAIAAAGRVAAQLRKGGKDPKRARALTPADLKKALKDAQVPMAFSSTTLGSYT